MAAPAPRAATGAALIGQDNLILATCCARFPQPVRQLAQQSHAVESQAFEADRNSKIGLYFSLARVEAARLLGGVL